MKKMRIHKTVDAYIKAQPKALQARLRKLRATIRKAAPGAVEKMSYGMVGYKLAGRPMMYFGCFKKHVGFFALHADKSAFRKELSKYERTKSSIHLPHDQPVPYGLVARIVRFRVKENSKR